MKRHVKRYQAQTQKWGISSKEDFWAPKMQPGAHPAERSVPLITVVRDILSYADTSREAKVIINERKLKVDGEVETEKNAPIGLMDVISFDDLDEHYRLLLDQHGKVHLVPIEEGRENWKLVRIEDKKTIEGGKTQYNLHDGRNLILDEPDAYKTKEVLKISVPSQKIIESFEFKEGNMALIIGGKHIGEVGTLKEHEIIKSSKPNLVHLEGGISTIEDYLFIIGEEKPEISIPEVGIL